MHLKVNQHCICILAIWRCCYCSGNDLYHCNLCYFFHKSQRRVRLPSVHDTSNCCYCISQCQRWIFSSPDGLILTFWQIWMNQAWWYSHSFIIYELKSVENRCSPESETIILGAPEVYVQVIFSLVVFKFISRGFPSRDQWSHLSENKFIGLCSILCLIVICSLLCLIVLIGLCSFLGDNFPTWI